MLNGIKSYIMNAIGWNNVSADVDEATQAFNDLTLDDKDMVSIPMPPSPRESSMDSIYEGIDSDRDSSENSINSSNEDSDLDKEFRETASDDDARLYVRAFSERKKEDILALLELASEKNNFPLFIFLSLFFEDVLDEILPKDWELKYELSSSQELLNRAAELGNLTFFIEVEQRIGFETNMEFNEVLIRAKQEGNHAIFEYLQKKYPAGIVGETAARVLTPRFDIYVVDLRTGNQAPDVNERLTSAVSTHPKC